MLFFIKVTAFRDKWRSRRQALALVPRNEKQQQMKHVTRQSCVSKLQTCNLLGPESQVVAESSRAEPELRRPQTQQPGGCLRKMSAPVGCHCCCMHNEQAGDTEGERSTPSDATQKGGESPSALVRQLEKFCCFFFFFFLAFFFFSFIPFLLLQPDGPTV